MSNAMIGTSARSLVVRPDLDFNAVKIFSATMHADRAQLGDRITQWIADHPQAAVTEFSITQSSDASFHCVAITIFYRETARG